MGTRFSGLFLSGLLLSSSLAGPARAESVAPPEATAQAPSEAQVRASMVIKVAKRDVAAEALLAKTKELNGYFATLASQQVVLRVPVAATDTLLGYASTLGLVVTKGYSRDDMSATLNDLRSRLSARQSVLARYLEVLGGAHADAVVTVEQQVTSLIGEIENLSGRIRLLENQVDYATVTVSFQFRERAAPRRDGQSSFPWLNSVNLADLIEGFRGGIPARKLRGVTVAAPDGFAAYDKARPFRAVSPDGVLFQVRTAKHEPEATLDFWKEALKKRMLDAGYTFVAERDVEASGAKGYLIELAAPMGAEDDSYWVAVFPDGRRLVIVEAAGEAGRFLARGEAIRAAILGMGI